MFYCSSNHFFLGKEFYIFTMSPNATVTVFYYYMTHRFPAVSDQSFKCICDTIILTLEWYSSSIFPVRIVFLKQYFTVLLITHARRYPIISLLQGTMLHTWAFKQLQWRHSVLNLNRITHLLLSIHNRHE